MSKPKALRVDRYNCVAACLAKDERDSVKIAAEDGTLAKTEKQLDHEDMIAELVPHADVYAAVAADGEPAVPEKCFEDAMTEARRVCSLLPTEHSIPLAAALVVIRASVTAIIKPLTLFRPEALTSLALSSVLMDKTLAALPSGDTE